MKKMKLFYIAVLAMGLSLAVSASQASTLGPFTTSTPIPATLTDWSGSLAFPKFDTNLGTLNSVTLTLSGSLSTVITVTNSSGTSSSGTAKTEVQLSVQDAGSNLTVPQLDLNSPAFGYSLSPSSSTSSGVLTKSGGSFDVYTLAAVLAEFSSPGGGTITLPASTFTQTLLANTGGNTNAAQVTNAALTGTVTYDYSIVPEPSTLALLGLGAIGLFGMLRRRNPAV